MIYKDIINKLNLVPLPEEGGFYKETYRSTRKVTSTYLGEKSESTAIYYLITQDSFSALHAVDQVEIFHFYAGAPVEMFQIKQDGTSESIVIGNNIQMGEIPQIVVPHGVWQGTRLKDKNKDSWALLGCTVAPGFDFANFHLQSRDELTKMFPAHSKMIKKFTN